MEENRSIHHTPLALLGPFSSDMVKVSEGLIFDISGSHLLTCYWQEVITNTDGDKKEDHPTIRLKRVHFG